jgi:hypothetical protein
MNRLTGRMFATAAVMLLGWGLLLSLQAANPPGTIVRFRGNALFVPLQTLFFGAGCVCAAFAFVYSLPVIRMNLAIGLWHFSLSLSAILMFVASSYAYRASPAVSYVSALERFAVSATLIAAPVLLLGQALFLYNFIWSFLRAWPGIKSLS